jgi:5-methylcytosine-specific restriction endonuclease McrA
MYILSQVPNPQYLKKNWHLFGQVKKVFDEYPELTVWRDVIQQALHPTTKTVKSKTKEKWKTEVFLKKEIQKCKYCKRFIHKTESEVDHIIPKDLGGFDETSNYVLSCHDCNNGKLNSPSTLLFNIFNFKTNFIFLNKEKKEKLKLNERFQILQWALFQCQKCCSVDNEIKIYYSSLNPCGSGYNVLFRKTNNYSGQFIPQHTG